MADHGMADPGNGAPDPPIELEICEVAAVMTRRVTNLEFTGCTMKIHEIPLGSIMTNCVTVHNFCPILMKFRRLKAPKVTLSMNKKF